MVGLVSPCIFNVVCIWYCLIGSLVIVHGHGTHTLAGLIVQTNHTRQFLDNSRMYSVNHYIGGIGGIEDW